MKKLTTSVLAVVLSSSFALVNAQEDSTKIKTENIEGVVVTALGIKREEKSLSYATQVVKADELNLTQNVDVKNAIVGKVSGVQLNGQAGSKLGETGKLRIRGAVSLLNDADPLYVLDGIIVDPSTIDTDILESINVLKGPNATSLYGVRAQYGVVVMTSKKGAKNRLSVEVNSTTNVDMVARTLKYQNEYGQGQHGADSFTTFVFDPSLHPADWAMFDGQRILTDDDYTYDESWGAKFDGQSYVPWYAWWADSPLYGQTASWSAQPNNVKDFYDKAMTYKNSISVSGGGEKFTARIQFTNLDQNGIIPYSNLKRNYLSLNGNYKFSDKFNVDAAFNMSDGRIQGEFDDGYGNQTSGSFNSWFGRDIDTSILKDLMYLENSAGYHQSWNWWGPNNYAYGLQNPTLASANFLVKPVFWINPYYWLSQYKNYTDRQTSMVTVAPSYKVTKDLTARVMFSRTTNNSQNKYFMPYELARNGSGTGSATPSGYLTLLNGFGYRNRNYTEDQYDARLTYQNKFSDFDLTVVGGANITNRLWEGNSQVMDFTGTTQWLVIPDVYDFRNTNIQIISNPYSYKQTYKSLFLTGSVGYKDLAYLDGSLRNDINSSYLNTNNSYVSYSLGASLLLHKFIPSNDILTFFKLRGGIAQIPADLSPTYTNPEYRFSASPYNGTIIGFNPTRAIDPNLEPAINDNKEVGLDFKFLRNRLSLSATYYNEKRNNEPIPVTTPSSSGYLDILINSATSKREGIELNLSGDVFKSENFNWNTSINFARNKSTILSVNENLDRIAFGTESGYGSFSYVQILQMPGYEWGQLYGTGIMKDANGNNVINEDGLYVYQPNTAFGSVLPKFTGGFFNSFSYKGITLSAAIDFQKGGKFFSLSEQWGQYSGLLEETAAINDRGFNVRDAVADGGGVHVVGVDESGNAVDMYVEAYDYFKQFHGNRIAEPFIHDASYIKLREVAISYQLPSSIFTGTGIKDLTIGLTARNPWLISVSKDNKHKQDPSEMSQNYGEDGQLPSTRGFGVNVKINF